MASEHDIAIFLTGLAILLLVGRVLGEGARRLGMPMVAGELAAGVVLGPTLLGRVAPGAERQLFPGGPAAGMLQGYTLLGSVLLLTLAGLEIDLSVVIRRRREAALTSLAGVVVPLTMGAALGLWLPASYLVDPSKRLLFAAFVGTALSISAMPVIAKTLLDLGLYRTDLGLLVMASAMVNDLIGWLLFSLLAGPMQGRAVGWGAMGARVVELLAFVLAVLGPGRWLLDRLLGVLARDRLSAASRVLSAIIVLAVAGAAVTSAMGVHAVFGAFIVAAAVGDSPRLRAETRAQVHEFVSNVFAPVFFAAVGVRVDFVKAFDPPLVGAVLLVACVGKIVGCAVGARAAGVPAREALGVGFAMNSRGAMEIILALVALEAGLIGEPMFVALVVMAITTSLLAGPALGRLLRARRVDDVRALLEEGAVVLQLRARSSEQAVRELARALCAGTPLDGDALAEAAIEQGAGALGGVGDGVALPHARLRGVPRPMLAFGRSEHGIDFDAPDGQPARLVFLLIVPEGDHPSALAVQAALARVVVDEAGRDALLDAPSRRALLDRIAFATPREAPATT